MMSLPPVLWPIRHFDVPFLVRRSWALRVPVPHDVVKSCNGRVGLSRRVRDLMDHWGLGVYGERISLRDACRLMGIGDKDPHAGKGYADLMASDPKAARAYLRNDLLLGALRSLGWRIELVR